MAVTSKETNASSVERIVENDTCGSKPTSVFDSGLCRNKFYVVKQTISHDLGD